MGRLELPTLGLENQSPTVHPVRIHDFSLRYSASHSDRNPQFGHEYAPHYAPRPQPAHEKSNGFFPIADCLPRAAPILGNSKRRLKQINTIQLIREQRGNRQQPLAFHTRPFVLCGLPLRRPPKSQLVHARHSGQFFLQVTAHPKYGLPFGQDRRIPLWAAALAVRQKSREVHFDTAAQVLDFVQLPKDGPHYRRIIQGFQCIFAMSIFFGTDGERAPRSVFDWGRFHFFDRMELCFNRAELCHASCGRQTGNTIILSESVYNEVNRHPIPAERHVVASLATLLTFSISTCGSFGRAGP